MQKYFPPNVRWTKPKGGLFLWVTLPAGMDTAKLLQQAVTDQVAFVPGLPFYPAEQAPSLATQDDKPLPLGHNSMRLNFSNASPAKIEQGIRRLGRVIERAMEKHDRVAA